MKHVLSALVGVVLIVALTLGSIFATPTSAPAAPLAQETEGCVITIAGVKVCGTLLGQPLPEVVEVTVPGPTITLPPVTVTDVVTIRPDPIRVTETIRPAPVRITETVTLPPLPQPTATVTESVPNGVPSVSPPRATVTETVRPNGQPVPTVTETATVTPDPEVTRQPDPESDTVEPNNDPPFFSPDIDFGDDTVTAGEAGVGLLGALLIIGLILAGMAYGFRRGIAVENREEAYFLRSMLDRSKTS
jgi:hypothetical protein